MDWLWLVVIQLSTVLFLLSLSRYDNEDLENYKWCDWLAIFGMSFIFPLGLIGGSYVGWNDGYFHRGQSKKLFGWLIKQRSFKWN